MMFLCILQQIVNERINSIYDIAVCTVQEHKGGYSLGKALKNVALNVFFSSISN